MSKTKRFPYKRIISVCLSLCMGVSICLAGCGSTEAEDEEIIELHEPQTGEESAVNTEKVACRNLYRTQVYSGVIFPYVEAYSYETGQKFGSYGALLGDEVKQGTPLVHMDTQDISKKIESMEERIRSLTETYEEFKTKTESEIAELCEVLEDIQDIMDDLEEEKPDEYLTGTSGQSTTNPAYASWQKDWRNWEGQYSNKELSVSQKTEALRQKTELYALDYQYYSGQLQKLRNEERAGTLTSQMDGKIVAMGVYVPGASIRANVPVSVVGDSERKFIKCSKVPELSRLRAIEIYAVSGGKRYEVTYAECEDADYSLFALSDGQEGTEIGDVAALVLVMDAREQVPTVSTDSIHRDGRQQYVYVSEDGKTVSKMIQTGMSDGVYTEILSGVEVGEQVMISQKLTAGDNTAVLERGVFEIIYNGSGNLVYPVTTVVKNPVENGTMYFQEYQVKEGQYVEKGDVIAAIRVEGNGVELARKETSLKRAKERLADLIAQDEEKNKDTIAQRRESIAELEEEIAFIKADYGMTEIRATASGYVLALSKYDTGDVVKSGNALAVIADENITFLSVTNESNYLNYGDVVEITYQDMEGKERTAEGTAATFGMITGGALASKEILVALPGGRLEDAQVVKETANGYLSVKIGVSAVLDAVKNVIMVPKRAVTEINGNTYVNVLTEDGTVMPVSFVAGGMNRDSYWVIEGLTEGMKICWE